MQIKLDKDTVGANIRTLPPIKNPVLISEFLSLDDMQSIMKLIRKSNPGLYELLNELLKNHPESIKDPLLKSLLILASEIARNLNGKSTKRRKLHKLP